MKVDDTIDVMYTKQMLYNVYVQKGDVIMEENKTKTSTLRINVGDEESFKQYLKENGYTQAEGFKNLVALMELDNAKEQLSDRAREIDTFRDTVNKLIGFYINSLEVNQVAEERIREEFKKELSTKDNTIRNLQEQLQEQKEKIEEIKAESKEISKDNKALASEKEKAFESIKAKEKENETLAGNNKMLQEQIITLNDIITEYKDLKDLNIKLEAENKELKGTHQNFKNELEQLNNKLINADDMLKFYKEQVAELKAEVKELNKSIIGKENTYKAEIKALEEKNIKELDKVKEELQEKLNSKHEVELGKKDIEIDKLKNMVNQLQDKLRNKVKEN